MTSALGLLILLNFSLPVSNLHMFSLQTIIPQVEHVSLTDRFEHRQGIEESV